MFPLLKNREKGNQKLAILLYVLLNLGIVLRIIFEPFLELNNTTKFIILISAILQLISIILYVYLLWNRVRMKIK
jgi:hypothetical protein